MSQNFELIKKELIDYALASFLVTFVPFLLAL